jgi:hypothetical protein
MVKKALAFVVVLGMGISLSASDSDEFLEFKGGIGVDPVSTSAVTATTVTPAPNTVRGVAPAGSPWRIDELKAEIEIDGSIKVKGKGLLLAGGNNIGTNANNLHVIATLICEAAPGPFTLRNTSLPGVALAPDGDFRIDDVLSPGLPAICASPVLLIRAVTGTPPAADGWLAAGILEQEDHDDDDD